MNHVFGPVPSRRLGRSLGVDLVPFKTCSYDCIYCQLGHTTHKTLHRRQWVTIDDILAEVKAMLPTRPDYITLSGSGEPTLHRHLGQLIEGIRSMTDTPVAVLTNGSLLWQAELRRELADAHLVVPSLDAGDGDMFQRINRPCAPITFDLMLDGLIEFNRHYRGTCWLEVLMLDGCTTTDAQVNAIAHHARRIDPDRVQLNTATRPTAEADALAVSADRLQALAGRFDPPAEIVADYRNVHQQSEHATSREQVLELLTRRPCSIDEIAEGLNAHRNEVIKHVAALQQHGRITSERRAGRRYFLPVPTPHHDSQQVPHE